MRKFVSSLSVCLLSMAVSTGALAYDLLPGSFSLSKSGNGWSMSPGSNLPVGAGRGGLDVIYAINQNNSLSDYATTGQYVGFQATWSGSGPNIFLEPVGSDHVLVGLNHRTFMSSWSVATGNRGVGVVIGLSCGGKTAITMEWIADDLGLPAKFAEQCVYPPAGATSLRFSLFASYSGYATLHVYDAAGNYVGSIYDYQPDYSGYGNTPAGAAVAAIGGTYSAPYQVNITNVSHGYYPNW